MEGKQAPAELHVIYCQRCGTSQLTPKGASPKPCRGCGSNYFASERSVSWKPFSQGWQTNHDRQFLKSLRIACAGHHLDRRHDPYT